MRDLDWNDLRYILCLSRTGRIAGAARNLGVNVSTVARRIARVEGALGVRLFERNPGILTPTSLRPVLVRGIGAWLFSSLAARIRSIRVGTDLRLVSGRRGHIVEFGHVRRERLASAYNRQTFYMPLRANPQTHR